MTMTQERPGEAAESFAALSAAVHPMWHQAILRLASAAEKMQGDINHWLGMRSDSLSYVQSARELAAFLIDFLDEIDGDPDMEPWLGEGDDREDDDEREHDDPGEEDGTAEPSLGSLEVHPSPYGFGRDRDGDQTGWAAGNRTDLEEDNDSGIGDQDGLDEQVPFRDWQNVGMV